MFSSNIKHKKRCYTVDFQSHSPEFYLANLKLSTNQETENTVIIHQQNQHHLLMLGPAVVFAQPTTGSIVFPLNSCEEHAPVFLNFPGNSLLELPFKERFFFTRFRLSNNTVLRGGTCEAPSTQPPACGQPQGLD